MLCVIYSFTTKDRGHERTRLVLGSRRRETPPHRAGTTFRKLDDADKEALNETKGRAMLACLR